MCGRMICGNLCKCGYVGKLMAASEFRLVPVFRKQKKDEIRSVLVQQQRDLPRNAHGDICKY
jgi:hypothetical protein